MRVFFVGGVEAQEEAAAFEWLAQAHEVVLVSSVRDADVVWFHSSVPIDTLPREVTTAFDTSQCGLVLSHGAAAAPVLLGLEPVAPAITCDQWRDGTDDLFLFDDFTESPRVRGHAGFRDHPIFDGLHSGAYTWHPQDGEAWVAARYFAPAWPARAQVIAVERAYIHVAGERATIWEYANSERRLVCVGAHLQFSSSHPRLRASLEKLAHNLLRYASQRGAPPSGCHWRMPGERAVRITAGSVADAQLTVPLPEIDHAIGLTAPARPEPFTLAARRTLIAGTERDGIHEIWLHPLRVVRDFTVAGQPASTFQVTPFGIDRTLANVAERIVAAPDSAAACVEWTARTPVTLQVEWTCDLRVMWPYPAGMLGDLAVTVADAAVRVESDQGDTATFCFSKHVAISSEASDGSVRLRAIIPLAIAESVRMIATTDDAAAVQPDMWQRAQRAAQQRRNLEQLRIEVPDGQVARAFEWAKYRLATYMVETPRVGTSLVAGYWHARPGWGDGRPGYAWYFGRDAVWTVLASLGMGDFASVRTVLAFLGRHQAVDGKILHECTTSGLVHYDSADATPLYLLLMARYFAASGDDAFVRSQWSCVRDAYGFCRSTDSDGDGLIENAGVGHGWVEFGPLGGGSVTFYNAGIWAAALRELAVTAESIGENAFAAELKHQTQRTRAQLERAFYDEASACYAHKLDGTEFTYVRDLRQAVTHAVPLLLSVADAGRARSFLDALASAAFTTAWGVRMIGSNEDCFDPRSYHCGTVWPLYTGWASWAEFTAGRARSAIAHWLSNMLLCYEREKGAWDEVLHGLERAPAGVCPDQAWSTAMALAPFVYGMLGVEPDAARGRLRLRPQIPADWNFLNVDNIRMGDASVSLRYTCVGNVLTYSVSQTAGAYPVRLILEPALTAPLQHATVDGIAATLNVVPFGERVVAPLQVILDETRVIVLEMAAPEHV